MKAADKLFEILKKFGGEFAKDFTHFEITRCYKNSPYAGYKMTIHDAAWKREIDFGFHVSPARLLKEKYIFSSGRSDYGYVDVDASSDERHNHWRNTLIWENPKYKKPSPVGAEGQG